MHKQNNADRETAQLCATHVKHARLLIVVDRVFRTSESDLSGLTATSPASTNMSAK